MGVHTAHSVIRKQDEFLPVITPSHPTQFACLQTTVQHSAEPLFSGHHRQHGPYESNEYVPKYVESVDLYSSNHIQRIRQYAMLLPYAAPVFGYTGSELSAQKILRCFQISRSKTVHTAVLLASCAIARALHYYSPDTLQRVERYEYASFQPPTISSYAKLIGGRKQGAQRSHLQHAELKST